jgi:hypothetical protein
MVAALTAPASATIFGEDQRIETEQAGAPWAALTRDAIVVMLDTSSVDLCQGVALHQPVATIGERQMLCVGERFIDQPVVARCSATLIEPDVIVTAAHCIPDAAACATRVFARAPYYASDGSLHLPSAGEVAACRRILVQPPGLDVAIVQLEHAIGDHPAQLAPVAPVLDAAIAAIGFPSGMPAKFSPCHVREVVPLGIRHDCDLFRGNSGSGTFDSAGRLYGVYSMGAGDYKPNGECRVPVIYGDDGRLPGVQVPQFGMSVAIADAVTALCEQGWHGSLCGPASPCTGTDCPSQVCGDGVCSLVSERTTCAADCEFLGCVLPPPPPSDAPAEPPIEPPSSDGGCAAAPAAGQAALAFVLAMLVGATKNRRRNKSF